MILYKVNTVFYRNEADARKLGRLAAAPGAVWTVNKLTTTLAGKALAVALANGEEPWTVETRGTVKGPRGNPRKGIESLTATIQAINDEDVDWHFGPNTKGAKMVPKGTEPKAGEVFLSW